MHLVQVKNFGSSSVPRNSVVSLTDHFDMTIAVYCGHKATEQLKQHFNRVKETILALCQSNIN